MKKYANVTYIENEVSKEMEAEIKMINDSQNPKHPFPKFHFHLFKNLNPDLEINFVIEAEDKYGIFSRVYLERYALKTDQISLIEEKTKFLLRQYKLIRSAGFLRLTFQQMKEYDKLI